MKKQAILSVICMLAAAGFAFGQVTFTFSDTNGDPASGTFNPNDTFVVDVSITFSGFTASGYSLWVETNNALAPFISITDEQYVTFTGPTDGPNPGSGDAYNVKVFTDSSGAQANFMSDKDGQPNPQTNSLDTGDLGATGSGKAANTYTVAHITFTLSGAPAGSFSLLATNTSPKQTEVSDTSNVAHNADNQALYSITVVPEPTTWSLMALGGLGAVGLTWLRARRRN